MTPVDTAAIAERVEAVAEDAERLTLKWNYNEYGMIRDMYTGRAYANVFVKPFDEFYLNAPADIRALLSENASLKAEVAALTAALQEIANSGTYGGNGDGEPGFAAADYMATYAQDVLWELRPETKPEPTPANGGSDDDQ